MAQIRETDRAGAAKMENVFCFMGWNGMAAYWCHWSFDGNCAFSSYFVFLTCLSLSKFNRNAFISSSVRSMAPCFLMELTIGRNCSMDIRSSG